jgi:hypothetical protein
VKKTFKKLAEDAFPIEQLCLRCGERFGSHCGATCPDQGSGTGGWTIEVPDVQPVSRLAIARDFQKQIAKLQTEREKLYAKAIKKLKLKDNSEVFDWFFNDQQGTSKFVEGLK